MTAQATSQSKTPVPVGIWTEGEPSLDMTITPELLELLDLAALINRGTPEHFNLSFSALMIAFYYGRHSISQWYRAYIEEQSANFASILTYRQLNDKELTSRIQDTELPFPNARDVYPNGKRTATISARRWLEIAGEYAREQQYQRTGLRHMMLAVIYTLDFHADELNQWRFDRRSWALSYLGYVARFHPDDLAFCQQINEKTFGNESTNSSVPSVESFSAGPSRQQSATGTSRNADSRPASSSESVAGAPFDLASYNLSEGERDILNRASVHAANRNAHLSTSDVLFEMIEYGRPGRDPQSAADFLRQTVSAQRNRYEEKIAAYRVGQSADQRSASDAVDQIAKEQTAGLAWCLRRASEIAMQASGNDVIAGRHLLAALILDPPSPHTLGSGRQLQDMGILLPLLRGRLYDWVRGYGDKDSVWRELLIGTTAEPYRKAQFDADGTSGPDLLNVEADVLALATLIAARDSSPPLSIGLFGDWGSGKTFFMGRLRSAIAGLAEEARTSNKMQRDLPFYKRIVQIEFNAWHYVEGNLWASMVEHILANLRVSEEQESTLTLRLQQHWIEKLGFAEKAKIEADQKAGKAAAKVTEAEIAVKQCEYKLQEKQEEVQALSQKSVAKAFELSGAAKVIVSSLEPLGVRPVSESALDLQSSLREASSLVKSGWSTLAPLVHAKDRRARFIWLLIVLAGAPIAAAVLARVLGAIGHPGIAQLSALAAGATGLLTGVAEWLRRQAEWMAKQIKKVEEAQSAFDREMADALAGTAAEKAKAEQELASVRQDYSLARQRADQARRDEEAAHSDLAAATTARLLGQFIQDRAASTDYRKHLGVLAVVRQDFQELSRLIEEDNWRLAPESPDDRRYSGLTKIKDLDEEARDSITRINRIVLYIDDLDRCPPAKVVDVLQAVHLLLAFPLFVVVVGVDARWISRSLEARYRELLHVGNAEGAVDLTHMFGVARSEDYLEKIFQIPLWLRTMDASTARRMIQGLLRPNSIVSHLPKDEVREAATGPELSSQGSSVDMNLPEQPRTLSSEGALPAGPSPADTEKLMASVPSASEKVERPRTAAVPNLESLKVEDFEIQTIDELSPLLGRSPRALKRFVNLYRLIKARLSPPEHSAFVSRSEKSMADYEAVLFLLAVDTGLPRASRMLFEELLALANESSFPNVDIKGLIERLDKNPSANTSDWNALREWMSARQDIERLNRGIERMVEWVDQVSRYSFQAAHLEGKYNLPGESAQKKQ
jgi:hypothetical protein